MPGIGTASHAKIASAGTVSGEVDLRGLKLVALRMPAAWTAGNISFQAAEKPTAEGGVYGDVTASTGSGALVATVVTGPTANQYVALNFAGTPQNCMLKVVSSVAQGADRDITLFVQSL